MTKILFILIGQFLSLIGSGIQSAAIPMYILKTTNSGLMVGLSQVISVTVTVLFSPIAGVLGDRYNRKTILVLSDLISGAVILTLYVLFSMNVGNLTFYFVSQALCTAAECMLMTSLYGILPEIVPEQHLTRTNAIRGIATSSALVIGPALGGVVFGFFGIKTVFLINALSFVASALLALMIRYRRTGPVPEVRLSIPAIASEISDAVRYVRSVDAIRRFVLFAIVLNFACAPVFYVLLPYLVQKTLLMTAQQYGVIQSFYMGGFAVGGLLLTIVTIKNPRRTVRLALLLLVASTAVLAMASVPGFMAPLGTVLVLSALILFIGLSDSISNTIVQTEIQKAARPDIMSRLGGVLNMAFQASMPLSLLIVGVLIDHLPLWLVFVPVALLLAVFVLLASGGLFRHARLTVAQDTAQDAG